MSEQSIRKQKARLARPIVLTVGAAGLFIVFKLFEPIFVYKLGWEALPREATPPIVTSLENETWSAKADEAERLLIDFYKNIDTAAISIAVAAEGGLVWRGAVGYADLKNKKPVKFGDQFRIGSTSKAVTSLAIGALYDKGLLQFDSPMGAFDPSLPEALQAITLGQAMSHRAGVRNYGLCVCFPIWEHLNRRNFSAVRDSIRVIEDSPLLFQPGKEFRYTSFGYNLAGLAAQSAAKRPFADVLEEAVFAPLGMSDTSLENIDQPITDHAIPYEIENGRYKRVFTVDNSIRWPSGGVLSTPTDIVQLGLAMLDDRLLSQAARNALLTIPEGGRANGGETYALGWRVSDWRVKDGYVFPSYNHNGVAVGGTSVFVIFPDHDVVVSAMMNKNATNVSELARLANQIAATFLRLEPNESEQQD